MDFKWGARKARENLRKHSVDFADAIFALEDSNALTIEDPGHNEPRFTTLGRSPSLDILYIVHYERSETSIRIISAHKKGRKETK